ncbi:uncharacterized protein PV07_07218 [Cladophialophora immunda]|uniref:Multiple myeloma tumor-associated protein 2-like N-terminal domain-containing protein n=1 Tax=Cladophialophora immunda TaxID=569365 RepID=A0A0D2CAM0_9EURO|nr:uncharacterized protein PV07_07218 [Cladophialophora immunda]KIW27485.1 hypothetical protein PV07_07218 [Cladophialophora immunda]
MDLLATVRKEGSRGGRGEFKWSDVEGSSHRENYLGHSLMAPVGRWQKGRDLTWYAKADADSQGDEDAAAKAARERKEEIQRVKQAEEDALARALGLPVPQRNNPHMDELGTRREVDNVLKEAAVGEDAASSRGVGYGRMAGGSAMNEGKTSATERLEGTVSNQDKELQYALKEYRRRHGERRHRSRSRSSHRHRDSRHRRHRDDRHRHRERQSRSPRRNKSDRVRSKSASPPRERDHHRRERSRSTSRSRRRPEGHRGDRDRRYEQGGRR